jgi:O-antigen ligase
MFRVNDFWTDPLGHAHNLYLNIMAESGFLGIVTYFGQWIAWIIVVCAGFRRSRSRFDRALAAGVLASLVGVALHNIFDNLSVHGLETETGLLVGLCGAIGRGSSSGSQEIA